MPHISQMSISLKLPNIVVPASSAESMNELLFDGAPTAPWDIVELRLDAFRPPLPIPGDLEEAKRPYLLTLRHPDEGGCGSPLSATERNLVLAPLVPGAAAIDLEVAYASEMEDTIDRARASGTAVVLSAHDFEQTPTLDALGQLVEKGQKLGADVVKIASRTESASDVTRLLALFDSFPDVNLALMGMGPLGMASRLLAAQCGSVLNYACAGEAMVEGQWPADEFRALLDRVGAREPLQP